MVKLHNFIEDSTVDTDTCICGMPRIHEKHVHAFKREPNLQVVHTCECSMPLYSAVHDTPKIEEKYFAK